MDTITLSVVADAARRIIVKSGTTTIPVDDREGNLDDVPSEAEIQWGAPADASVEQYTVQFFEYGTKGAVWPFEGSANGPGNSLLVKPGHLEKRKLKASFEGKKLKYAVEATPAPGSSKIHPVDPMIIIRPPEDSKWWFGLICAALGAVLGAVLATLLAG